LYKIFDPLEFVQDVRGSCNWLLMLNFISLNRWVSARSSAVRRRTSDIHPFIRPANATGHQIIHELIISLVLEVRKQLSRVDVTQILSIIGRVVCPYVLRDGVLRSCQQKSVASLGRIGFDFVFNGLQSGASLDLGSLWSISMEC
jgi:hypothetical protein